MAITTRLKPILPAKDMVFTKKTMIQYCEQILVKTKDTYNLIPYVTSATTQTEIFWPH